MGRGNFVCRKGGMKWDGRIFLQSRGVSLKGLEEKGDEREGH